MLPRGLRRGKVNFRSHNSRLSLGASPPGRRRECALLWVSFWGGYSPTGLPGDTVWLAFLPTGWSGLSVLSQPPERVAMGSHPAWYARAWGQYLWDQTPSAVAGRTTGCPQSGEDLEAPPKDHLRTDPPPPYFKEVCKAHARRGYHLADCHKWQNLESSFESKR